MRYVAAVVVVISIVLVTIVVVRMIAVAIVIAAVVAAMPRCVPVVGAAVIVNTAAVPMAAPAAPSPSAAAAAHHGADSYPRSEREQARGHQVAGRVSRSCIRSSVDDSRVIARDVHHLRIRRLNYDHLCPALRLGAHRLLRSRLQIAGSLSLLA